MLPQFFNSYPISVGQTNNTCISDISSALIMIEGGTSRDPEKIKMVNENFEILIPRMHG